MYIFSNADILAWEASPCTFVSPCTSFSPVLYHVHTLRQKMMPCPQALVSPLSQLQGSMNWSATASLKCGNVHVHTNKNKTGPRALVHLVTKVSWYSMWCFFEETLLHSTTSSTMQWCGVNIQYLPNLSNQPIAGQSTALLGFQSGIVHLTCPMHVITIIKIVKIGTLNTCCTSSAFCKDKHVNYYYTRH